MMSDPDAQEPTFGTFDEETQARGKAVFGNLRPLADPFDELTSMDEDFKAAQHTLIHSLGLPCSQLVAAYGRTVAVIALGLYAPGAIERALRIREVGEP